MSARIAFGAIAAMAGLAALGSRRGSRGAGPVYYHVTGSMAGAREISREGLHSTGGICGDGVYLWDTWDSMEQNIDDWDEGAVVLAITPGPRDRIEPCDPSDVEQEGDWAYYEHVSRWPGRAGEVWRPKRVEIAGVYRGWEEGIDKQVVR